MKAEITDEGFGKQKIVLDGTDFSDAIGGYTLAGRAGEKPALVLTLPMAETLFDGEVRPFVTERTREALLAIGWTPPAA